MHANGCNILDIRHKSCAPKVSFVTITEPKLYLCCMLKFRHLLLWKSLSLIWPQLLQSSRELRIIGICMCYFMGTCLFQIGEKGRHCKHSIVTECHRWETTLSLQVMQNFSSDVFELLWLTAWFLPVLCISLSLSISSCIYCPFLCTQALHFCFCMLGWCFQWLVFHPMYCRYLNDTDDGVSEAMVPFAVQYLSILKVWNCP